MEESIKIIETTEKTVDKIDQSLKKLSTRLNRLVHSTSLIEDKQGKFGGPISDYNRSNL